MKINIDRKDWIRLPFTLFLKHGLSPTEACIMSYLLDKDHSFVSDKSNKEIATLFNVSTKTVTRAMQKLEEVGLIAKASGKEQGKANSYLITDYCNLIAPKKRKEKINNDVERNESKEKIQP